VNRAWKLLRDSGELREREEVWTGIYNSKDDVTLDFMSRARKAFTALARRKPLREVIIFGFCRMTLPERAFLEPTLRQNTHTYVYVSICEKQLCNYSIEL